MDDVERLFRTLVQTLADQRPQLLHHSFHISELYQDILPYRQFRRALRLDTNEDYEMAVLRLLAGVHGFVSLDSPEARETLQQESEAISPFPGAFRDFAAVSMRLDAQAVDLILSARASYAPAEAPVEAGGPPEDDPPEHAPTPTPTPTPAAGPSGSDPPGEALKAAAPPYLLDNEPDDASCSTCSRALPQGRTVVYCPFCGARVSTSGCRACGAAFEAEWDFCIACGRRTTGA